MGDGPEKGPYTELAAIAAAFGQPYAGSWRLLVHHEGNEICVELAIDSGVVRGLTLRAIGRRWPSILLRREDDQDRRGKQIGVTRELQTGDAEFDDAVFIDTDQPDAVVTQLLTTAERRHAARSLVRLGELRLGADGIFARIDDSRAYDPAWLRANALIHLQTLSGAPPMTPAVVAKEDTGSQSLLLWSAIGAVLIALVTIVVTFSVQRLVLAVVGAAIGLGVWYPARLVMRRLIRGHSRAYESYLVATGSLAFVLVFGLAATTAVLNALVDAEPPRKVRGTVRSIAGADAHVRFPDGSEVTITMPSSTKVGDDVVGFQRRGLFGWVWETRATNQ